MRSDLEVADIFRRHDDAYRRAHDDHLGRVERRVMSAIELCRTAALGGHVEACEDCAMPASAITPAATGIVPSARAEPATGGSPTGRPSCCRSRTSTSCSRCRPQSPRSPSRTRQSVYAILFDAVAADARRSPPIPGISAARSGSVAVLHTWGQNLPHHPHIHCVVPGGALSADGRWIACRPGFFLPVRVLSRLFRRLFLERLQAALRPGDFASSARSPASADPCLHGRDPAAVEELGRLRQAAVWLPEQVWPISAATPIASPSPTVAW